MDSTQAATSSTKSVSDEEWDTWRDFILDEFLVKDRGLHATLESLKQRNPNVTLAKLRTKLKKWSFQKSLSDKEWQYVNHAIQRRTSRGKDSAIILSGVRFSSDYVKKQTNRHKAVTLFNKHNPPPSPEPPDEDVPLYICTPRATSPAITPYREWPRSLPWIQFNESPLPELMSGLRLLPAEETETAMVISDPQQRRPRKKRRPNMSVAWVAFENLARRSMAIVMGCEELSRNLIVNKSVDRIASRLNDIIPPTYQDENVRRAIVLSGGARYETQKEILKMMIFLLSNRLIMNLQNPFVGYDLYIDDARSFVDIFRFSGLVEPATLSRIVKLSRQSLTLSAILDRLYEAAVNTKSFDLALQLLAVDDRIDLNRCIGRPWFFFSALTALEFGIFCGSVDFTRRLIQLGANINLWCGDFTPIELTLFSELDICLQLTQLLLESGADIKGRMSEAVPIMIMRGSVSLINLLHKAGADFTSTCPQGRFEIIRQIMKYKRDGTSLKNSKLSVINNTHTCLGAAASFPFILIGDKTAAIAPSNDESDFFFKDPCLGNAKAEDIALDLVKHIINITGPNFDVDNRLKSDAMIFAASRGYNKVVSFLHDRGAFIGAKNGSFCAVYAAVSEARVECCRLLLELGGSAQAERRRIKCLKKDAPQSALLSPLHVAVSYHSYELVDLLLRSGVDINLPRIPIALGSLYRGFGPQIKAKFGVYEGDEDDRVVIKKISPLALAVEISSWEIALLLLDRGASSTGLDLKRAAEEGQFHFISRLLKKRLYSNKDASQYSDALEASIRNGHESIALNLLESGVSTRDSTMSLALRYGQYNFAMRLIQNGVELTGPECVGAFRMPDVLWIQSLTQHRSPINYIGGRSQDGRTFLENAILSDNIAVIKFALSLDSSFYDSGALCAIVVATTQSSSLEMAEILKELIRRRDFIDQSYLFFDQILENTAMSIAAHHQRFDIIRRIRRRGECTAEVAVLPGIRFIKVPEYTADYDHSYLATNRCHVPLSIYKEWDNWHDPESFRASPLLLSIKAECGVTIEALLDLGYKPDAHSLKAAIYHRISMDLTRRLIKGCTDLNATEIVDLRHNYTPLHVAGLTGQLDIVKILLDNGADPNAGSWEHRDEMLYDLARCGRFDIFDILHQSGIDINGTPSIRLNGGTPLQDICRFGSPGTVRRLLDYGANLDARGSILEGYTALEAAARFGRLDTVQLLLESGVSTQGCEQLQYILAIHDAMQRGHSAISETLKSHRKWQIDDWKLFRKLRNIEVWTDICIRLSEYTRQEITQVLDMAWGTRQEITQILNMPWSVRYEEVKLVFIGPRNTVTGLLASRPKFERQWEREGVIILDISEDSGDDDETSTELSETETILSSEGISSQVDVEETEIERPTSVYLENIEERPSDNSLRLGDEVDEDRERRQRILDDMLGVREAPMEPMEWSW